MSKVIFFFKQIDIEEEEEPQPIDEEATVAPTLQPTIEKLTAEQVLNNMETDETKVLSNEQLKRYVLLQKCRVLTLQQKRLEKLISVQNEKNVTFDFIGFEDEISDTIPSVTKPWF